MTTKILMISKPGGDRGPAIGYKNHMNAFLSDSRFSITELTESMIKSGETREYDIIWAYVRFHPSLFNYFKNLNKTFIGGPNVLFERGDIGPTDEWEYGYCSIDNLDYHINNSEYYLNHVKKFIHKNTKTFVHEACYDVKDLPLFHENLKRKNDVLIYYKKRVNDSKTDHLYQSLIDKLETRKIKYSTLEYGKYHRDEFIKLSKMSKTCVWLSIEDYCSLAQIESHLCGCPVIGTQYNLTIPTSQECIVEAQNFNKWIEWKNPEIVSDEFIKGIDRILSIDDISNITLRNALQRHSYETYTQKIFDEVVNKC